VPVITEYETYIFMVIIIIIKMGHDTRDTLKDYLAVTKQFLTPSYNKTIVCDTFLNILVYVHFSNNYSATDTKNTPTLDRLWEMRYAFDMLSDVHAKFYSVLGRLTEGKVTVVFKGRIIFKQCISMKHKLFRKKNYTLCDVSEFMHTWMCT
jgi:hypothetical protein